MSDYPNLFQNQISDQVLGGAIDALGSPFWGIPHQNQWPVLISTTGSTVDVTQTIPSLIVSEKFHPAANALRQCTGEVNKMVDDIWRRRRRLLFSEVAANRHRRNRWRAFAFRLYRWLGCPRLAIGGL